MEPASLTTWLQPLQLRTQSIQSVRKCQVLFRILQTFKNFNLLFIGQMIESQSEKCLAQNESNISVGVHVGSSLIKVKDTHLMNNNQPVAEILCWRLTLDLARSADGKYKLYWMHCRSYHRLWWNVPLTITMVNHFFKGHERRYSNGHQYTNCSNDWLIRLFSKQNFPIGLFKHQISCDHNTIPANG